uniref:Uncharacterized protein n=1 Tax=Trichogramma kaykai TaxID=54128 RepID=A0ABD2XF64_9HYME
MIARTITAVAAVAGPGLDGKPAIHSSVDALYWHRDAKLFPPEELRLCSIFYLLTLNQQQQQQQLWHSSSMGIRKGERVMREEQQRRWRQAPLAEAWLCMEMKEDKTATVAAAAAVTATAVATMLSRDANLPSMTTRERGMLLPVRRRTLLPTRKTSPYTSTLSIKHVCHSVTWEDTKGSLPKASYDCSQTRRVMRGSYIRLQCQQAREGFRKRVRAKARGGHESTTVPTTTTTTAATPLLPPHFVLQLNKKKLRKGKNTNARFCCCCRHRCSGGKMRLLFC